MNIIRQYKLYRLGISIRQRDIDMFKYLDDKFEGLKLFEYQTLYKPSSHFFYINSNYECIYELIMNKAYVCKNVIWDDLVIKFSLTGWKEKEEILCYLITSKYGLKINSINTKVVYNKSVIEEFIKENKLI